MKNFKEIIDDNSLINFLNNMVNNVNNKEEISTNRFKNKSYIELLTTIISTNYRYLTKEEFDYINDWYNNEINIMYNYWFLFDQEEYHEEIKEPKEKCIKYCEIQKYAKEEFDYVNSDKYFKDIEEEFDRYISRGF